MGLCQENILVHRGLRARDAMSKVTALVTLTGRRERSVFLGWPTSQWFTVSTRGVDQGSFYDLPVVPITPRE